MKLLKTALVAVGLSIGVVMAGGTTKAARVYAEPAQQATGAPALTADRGATLFRQRCGSCHSVVPGARSPQGPHLAGVVGRRAGTAPGYTYSRGMLAANRTWTSANLDAYLSGPSRAVPGTRMITSVNNPSDRAAIVAWLATQRAQR